MSQLSEALDGSFITRESCGPDDHYVINIKFKTLGEMQSAYTAILEAIGSDDKPKKD